MHSMRCEARNPWSGKGVVIEGKNGSGRASKNRSEAYPQINLYHP